MKNIFISKQFEDSKNYQEFLKLIKDKNINVKILEKGDKLQLEKNLKVEIIMLFTGDIEEEAERKILETTNKEKLKCDILKVAHHGSKTSSIEEFIDLANPKIALIGVGKNNRFGHPNESVIERIKKKNIKIYRTDLDGEITIKINCINLATIVNTTKKDN